MKDRNKDGHKVYFKENRGVVSNVFRKLSQILVMIRSETKLLYFHWQFWVKRSRYHWHINLNKRIRDICVVDSIRQCHRRQIIYLISTSFNYLQSCTCKNVEIDPKVYLSRLTRPSLSEVKYVSSCVNSPWSVTPRKSVSYMTSSLRLLTLRLIRAVSRKILTEYGFITFNRKKSFNFLLCTSQKSKGAFTLIYSL